MSETINLPVIDIGNSLTGHNAARREAAHAIWDALSRYGFFYVKNHGVSEELIGRSRRQFAGFFAQPLEKKNATKGHLMRGYSGFLELGLAPAVSKDAYAVNDLCERMTFGREVSEEERAADEYYQAPFANVMIPPNRWPTDAASTGLKDTALAYFHAMDRLFEHLMEEIAIAADLPKEFWVPFFTKRCSALSGINYPPPPADLYQPGVLRLKEHADLNVLTILAHENLANGGDHFEVLVDGRWQAAPAKEGTLLVNIGEVMEIITRGQLKATRHRVVMPESPEGSERLSLVFFCNPNYDATFETIPSCVPPGEQPQRLNYTEYLSNIFSRVRGHEA